METKEWISNKTLSKLQAVSGLAFGTFASLHLCNTITANLGYKTYNGVMNVFRIYYQNPVVELVVVGVALVTHMTCSFIKINRRMRLLSTQEVVKNKGGESSTKETDLISRLKETFVLSPEELHAKTGIVLLVFVLGHIAATRVAAWNHPLNFSSLSFTLSQWPMLFYPYYILFGISGVYHLSYGALQAFRILGFKVPLWMSARRKPFKLFVGLTNIAVISAIAAFGGWYFSVPTEKFMESKLLFENSLPSSLHFLLPWDRLVT